MENTFKTTRRQRVADKELQERRQATPREKQLIHLPANIMACSLIKYDHKQAGKGTLPALLESARLAEWWLTASSANSPTERSLETRSDPSSGGPTRAPQLRILSL